MPRGRLPTSHPRHRHVTVRLSDAEYAAVTAAAGGQGLTVSGWARRLLMQLVQPGGSSEETS